MPSLFPNLLHLPCAVFFLAGNDPHIQEGRASTPSHLQWEGHGVKLELRPLMDGSLIVHLQAEGTALRRVYLRWQHSFPSGTRFLGDAWERSYGELEWRGGVPHHPLPWYFLVNHGKETAGYGVATGANSIACWTTDAEGITLELDVRAGGVGVKLGSRALHAATILQRLPQDGESPYAAARGLCRALCPRPILPSEPVIGHNDWYWLYGKNSAAQILEATQRFVELCPGNGVRPWSVIDDGWQASRTLGGPCGGPWDASRSEFPDMPGLATQIRALGARPGIWMRPLFTRTSVPASWLANLPGARADHAAGFVLDPTVPEVIAQVRTDVARLAQWGFEMIKHDFSTYDITGRWGFEMNAAPDRFAADGWSFSDSSRTTAEVITHLYQTIREAAGPRTTLIGCNTVGHLAAGLVEIQRIGDDTSASDWDRTRRMGVNTLAFRATQDKTFFAADADCVPISPSIPWPLTKAWLDLVARSATPLFLSMDPRACGAREKAAIKEALAFAATPSSDTAEPLDGFDTSVPAQWRLPLPEASPSTRFEWSEWKATADLPPFAES